jgi:hypothetical protein
MNDLQHIRLSELWPSSASPVRVLGRFLGDELICATAPDMCLEWCRYPDETAEAFERRISNSILEARGSPPLPTEPPRVEMRLAHAPKVTFRANEPQHKGSRLANPNVPERQRPSPSQRRRIAG